jgi:sec-independent protein translocase protein TatC
MSDDPNAHQMTFWEHLEELRSRLLRMLLAFAIGGTVSWIYRETLLKWLTKPFVAGWKGGPAGVAALHFPAPASLFVAYIKLAVLGGLVLALPIMLYQLWSFIAPGLYSREKRLTIPFVVSSCLLFAAGGYFCWRVVFPVAFQYLLGFAGQVGDLQVTPTVMIDEYIDFCTRMLVAFGVVFELPVLVMFLSIAGFVTHRHLIKFARYFVVVAFVIAAVITPPDIASQFLLAIPLCLLYVVSIGVAWIFSRGRQKPAESAE